MPASRTKLQPHEQLRSLLAKARAESCHVVATFIDIRGFSSFSAGGESFDVAVYLRAVFLRILNDYFPDVDYFKPTGDGMMLINEFDSSDPETLPPLITSILGRSIQLVDEFGDLTTDDIMVGPHVPKHLGIGVARGAATKLVSDGRVLDYTGRCLNLAARLMDKARPQGVVFSDPRAAYLLDPEIAGRFTADEVCIRGISDTTPLDILVTDSVVIRPADREPVRDSPYLMGETREFTVREVTRTDSYGFHLPRRPQSFESAGVYVQIPIIDGKKKTDSVSTIKLEGQVEVEPGGCVIYTSFAPVRKAVEHLPDTFEGFWGNKQTKISFRPYILKPQG